MTTGWTVAAVYFVREVGMGPLELVLAGTALKVAYFLFEVSTAVVADTYSRRASIVLAQVLMGAGLHPDGRVRRGLGRPRRGGPHGLRLDVEERRRGRLARRRDRAGAHGPLLLVLVPALWLYGRAIRLGSSDVAYTDAAREA